MPSDPTSTPALLAAARTYALSTWTYDPADYRSSEHRDVHINADARGTAREPWFVALWEAGIAEGRRQATEGLPRKWGVGHPSTKHVIGCEDEAHAHEVADDLQQGHYVVSKIDGPWETAEPAGGAA